MSKVVIYTTRTCPYCIAATNLLSQRKIQFEEVLIADDDDDTWNKVCKRSGMRTVPQIFHGDQLIGGYRELSELDSREGLSSLNCAPETRVREEG